MLIGLVPPDWSVTLPDAPIRPLTERLRLAVELLGESVRRGRPRSGSRLG